MIAIERVVEVPVKIAPIIPPLNSNRYFAEYAFATGDGRAMWTITGVYHSPEEIVAALRTNPRALLDTIRIFAIPERKPA